MQSIGTWWQKHIHSRSILVISCVLVSYVCIYFSLLIIELNAGQPTFALKAFTVFGDFILLSASGFLIYYRKAEWRTYWIYIALAIAMYALGDMYWFAYELTVNQIVPVIDVSGVFYLLANLFLLGAVLSLVFNQKNRLHIFQMILDSLIAISLIGIGIWYLVGFDFIVQHNFLSEATFLIFLYLVVDICIIAVLFILHQVYRQFRLSQVTSRLVLLQLAGFLTYIIADIIEYYQRLNGTFIGNDSTQIMWMFGFAMMIYAGFLTLKHEKQVDTDQAHPMELATKLPTNIGVNTSMYLHIFAWLAIIFSSLNLGVILIVGSLLTVRYFISKHLEVYLFNQILLEQYAQVNSQLEQTVYDRTCELLLKNDELEQMANYDVLTGLPNSRYMHKYLEHSITKGDDFALLFVDLDRFKVINDWYGHDIGDALLVGVAQRLCEILPESAFVARQGGDEFIVVLTRGHRIKESAQKIVTAFQQPFILPNHRLHTTVSIGIAMHDQDGKTAKELMKAADIALYEVKNANKNNFAFYCQLPNNQNFRHLKIEHGLYDALENAEFELYYQPQFDLLTSELTGCEAIIQWTHPKLGKIPASEFLPLAEENGTIHEIGEWMIVMAAQQAKMWKCTYPYDLKIGINVVPKQLQKPYFVEKIERLINLWSVDPHLIELEITETNAITDREMITNLCKLYELGIGLAIDDFGTNYSSLRQFKNFPIQTLKIAKDIVSGIEHEQIDRTIIQAIINLNNEMQVTTIAENVQTQGQLELLTAMGCQQGQGDYLGKAVCARDFAGKYLTNNI